jgi:hypothetical protein
MDGVHMLIVAGNPPSYYMIPKVTEQEYRYLNTLEGAHVEDVHYTYKKNGKDKELYEAMCYVHAAIGYQDKRGLESLDHGLSNIKACVDALGIWEDYQVDTLAEINDKYRGNIDAVFCMNNSDM